jgi:hypothetical protein
MNAVVVVVAQNTVVLGAKYGPISQARLYGVAAWRRNATDKQVLVASAKIVPECARKQMRVDRWRMATNTAGRG